MFQFQVADRIATIVLDRPPANAINPEWVVRFNGLLDDLEARDDWNVLHIRSAHRLFSAGADIKEMRTAFETRNTAPLVAAVRDYQKLFDRIERLNRMTLAEINGAAMGGGFELALSCDLRIVADEVKIGLPEIRIGLLPGAGGTQRLTRLCGRAIAMRVINGAEMIDGKTAVELGMAQWHAPLAELPSAALAIARRFADQPPHASRLAKACINEALPPARQSGFDLEYTGSKTLLESDATHALVSRFLAQKS